MCVEHLLSNFLLRKFIGTRTPQKTKITPAAWSMQGEVGFWLVTPTGQSRRIPVSEQKGRPFTLEVSRALKAK